jgi:hypothetical protein
MTPRDTRRRMAWAIVVAVALAFALTVVKAEEEYFPVQRPECMAVDPYSWLWFFFGCNPGAQDSEDTMTTMEVLTLEDGSQVVIIETKPVKKEQK